MGFSTEMDRGCITSERIDSNICSMVWLFFTSIRLKMVKSATAIVWFRVKRTREIKMPIVLLSASLEHWQNSIFINQSFQGSKPFSSRGGVECLKITRKLSHHKIFYFY